MSPYALGIREVLETEEGEELFKQRSRTVEAPYGTLKRNHNIDSHPLSGIKKLTTRITLLFSSYN